MSNDESSKTVTLPKQCLNGANAQNTGALTDSMYNFSAIARDSSVFDAKCPSIKSGTIVTMTSMTYKVGSSQRSFTARSTNTDVPNDLPTFGC